MPRDWVFPIVLALFVGVVVWFAHEIHDFLIPPSTAVTIPSFVGQSLNDANAEVGRLKLSSAVVDHTTSDRYPKGVVIMQRPAAGEQAREGRQVSFVVSDGIVNRLMPDLRYQSLREVQLDLSRVRLRIGKISYAKSDIVPEAHVISQTPVPLSDVNDGDSVDLVVSRGGLATLQVPQFTGMSVDDARDLAARSGVKLGQIVWTPLGPSGPAHGAVVRQIPAPGSKIASFDPVSLQVSAGPFESGYVIRQVRLLASVPAAENDAGDQPVDVRVTVTDATGKYDLYRAFAQPGQKLDFIVTAVGTSVVDMYVNDQLVGEERLGKEPPIAYGNKPVTPKPSGAPSAGASRAP